MMNSAGIISEFNPFHNGHQYLLQQLRSQAGASHVVTVMSGSFVQRGDVAIFDKWTRAKAAVLAGCDLIVELPAAYSLSSAENFALGGVTILNALNINLLGFGSECGDLELLRQAAALSGQADFKETLKRQLSEGVSYPAAFEVSAARSGNEAAAAVLTQPNNTLACEYLRAIGKTNSGLIPYTVIRKGAGHNDRNEADSTASATRLREIIIESSITAISPYVPAETYTVLKEAADQNFAPVSLHYTERALLSLLRMLPKECYSNLSGLSEGLEHRLQKAISDACTLDEIYFMTKSKRYPLSRIRRLVMCAVLGITKVDAALPPQYIRVLALNDRGRELIAAVKKSCPLPILTKPADIKKLPPDAVRQFTLECRATDLYAALSPQIRPCGLDYTTSPLYINNKDY